MYEDYIEGNWVGAGWDALIWAVIKAADQLMDEYPALEKSFGIVDMKEKFGTLRLVLRWNREVPDQSSNEYMDALVAAVEGLSAFMCEKCGKPGYVTNAEGYWVKTLCGECATVKALQR